MTRLKKRMKADIPPPKAPHWYYDTEAPIFQICFVVVAILIGALFGYPKSATSPTGGNVTETR